MQMRVQRCNNKRRRRTPVGCLQVVGVLEELLCVREVLQQSFDELFLLLGRRLGALDDLHTVPRGDILHISRCLAILDVAAFLYQPRHVLLLLMEQQHVLERDVAVSCRHLTNTAAAHLAVLIACHIHVTAQQMVGHVVFYHQLE